MEIRKADVSDIEAIAKVESRCFPAAEAADFETVAERVQVYPDHFWLLYDGDVLVGFVNGMVTDMEDLKDEMYADASMHDEKGMWQMIFGVDTIPEYRNRGCAAKVLNQVIDETRKNGKKGLVLTCKEKLIHYYASFGFVNEGISESVHGNVTWYQMRLTF